MSNKTLIPAFQCKVGDWNYYICTMKYGEVARQVNFAYEMSSNTELGQLIQRGITNRTQGITDYLLASEHRFLGGIVVAAWGGEPQYTPLMMDDPEGLLSGLDQGFGVLTFDGTQNYFVLDGQHRLRAIKEAIKKNQDLLKEDICVLIVTHYDTNEGRVRTRRLFSNINRNAKKTDVAEDIALDEDDSFAVLTRRMLDEHSFLKQDGRVRVILSTTEDGGVKLAGNSIPKGDARAFTSITVLYDLLRYLSYDCPSAIHTRTIRPDDDTLDQCYGILSGRIDDMLKYCGDIRSRFASVSSAKDLRAPKNAEGEGHPFMRPVVQKAIANVLSNSVQQGLATWDELMARLAELSWVLNAAPWNAVATEDGRMLVGKDNTELLRKLLQVHLAPPNMAEIKRVRKDYASLRGSKYPVSEEELAHRLVQGGTTKAHMPIHVPTEISDAPIILFAPTKTPASSDVQEELAGSPYSDDEESEEIADSEEA